MQVKTGAKMCAKSAKHSKSPFSRLFLSPLNSRCWSLMDNAELSKHECMWRFLYSQHYSLISQH